MSLLEIFTYHCRAKNLAKPTIKSYLESFRILDGHAKLLEKDIRDIDKSDIQQLLLSKLNGDWSGGTANHRLRNWSVFYNFLMEEGVVDYNPAAMVSKCKQAKRLKKTVTPEEFSRILKLTNKKTYPGYRDYTMFLLMYDCMLRLNETINLRLDNITFEPRQIIVFGKGAKERNLSFSYRVAIKLKIFLAEFRKNIPGEYLFPTKSGRRLNKRNVQRTIVNLSTRCGLRITPHMIRHSAATEFWKQTGDVMTAKMILGHSSVKTTEIYIHGDSEHIRQQYERFSPAVSLKL